MKSALIIGNGEMSVPLTADFTGRFDLTVALDGAFNKLPSELVVDYVCGDLDSLTFPILSTTAQDESRNSPSKTEVVELSSQDANDLEKTLLWLQERGIGKLVIVNIWGGRIDQTLASLSILIRHHKDLEIVLYSENTAIRVFSEGQHSTIATQKGDGVSLAVVSESSRVSLRGVKWSLESEDLFPGSRGVSNEATGETVILDVQSGVVILTHTIRDEQFALRTL
jgi:thiamine pyrophosphokinase